MTVYGVPVTGRSVRVQLGNGASEGCIVSGSLLTPRLLYSFYSSFPISLTFSVNNELSFLLCLSLSLSHSLSIFPSLVLEVGSGSGQHTYHFSKSYPNVTFQPTEYDTALLASIDAYASDLLKEGHLIRPALELDATNSTHWKHVLQAGQEQGQEQEEQPSYDVVMTTNVFHISPWVVGQSIIRGAGRVLKPGGRFFIYGPFKRDGTFNTESNREVRRSFFLFIACVRECIYSYW